MADKKISQLTASTVPLAGTEVLPIVQSGTTKQVSVANVLNSAQPSGTANAVAFLNATKQLTSGSNWLYNGTNAALGVSPADWYAPARANQISSASFAGLTVGTVHVTYVGSNWYVNAATADVYLNDGSATLYTQANGTHVWRTAASGTAGNAISFTQVGEFDASGNFKVNNGNVIVGTSGKGIDFSADGQAAGMTSELLDDYEEGTWTPTDGSGAGLTLSVSYARYTKIGRAVYIETQITYPSTVSGAVAAINGLPFNVVNYGVCSSITNSAKQINGLIGGTNTIYLRSALAVDATNADMSDKYVIISGFYTV